MLLVSGCDKLHNALAIVRDLEDPAVGAKVFERFTGGREGTLHYYESLHSPFAAKDIPIAPILGAVIERMHTLAGAQRKLANLGDQR